MTNTKAYLHDLVRQYRALLNVTGPITFGLSQEQARKTPKELIWTLVDDQSTGEFGTTMLVNNFVEDVETYDEIFDYGVAQNPYPQGSATMAIAEVVWIACPDCEGGEISDPDDCEKCEQNGTLFLDVEEVAKNGPFNLTEDYVWSQLQAS